MHAGGAGTGNAVGIARFDEGMAHLLMAAADYVVAAHEQPA